MEEETKASTALVEFVDLFSAVEMEEREERGESDPIRTRLYVSAELVCEPGKYIVTVQRYDTLDESLIKIDMVESQIRDDVDQKPQWVKDLS